jgi:hypothetical protein
MLRRLVVHLSRKPHDIRIDQGVMVSGATMRRESDLGAWKNEKSLPLEGTNQMRNLRDSRVVNPAASFFPGGVVTVIDHPFTKAATALIERPWL